jgi:hypothetical protein
MRAVNKKIFFVNLAVTWCLIFGAWFLTLKYLEKVVPERVAGRLVQSGTEGMGFDRGLVGDKAAGPLRSLLALWAINQALDAYPPAFLKAHGPNILLTNKLTLVGYTASGTVQTQKPKSWVILASNYLLYTMHDLESMRRTFHHEFSSILLDNAPFPHADWEAALPEGFTFPPPPHTNEEVLKSLQWHATAAEMPPIYARGFVRGYGRSNEENDINTYAEFLLEKPDELAALAARYPAIAKKAALISGFYQSLDPGFKTQPFTNLTSHPSPSVSR